jgi:hypothetical protein
MRSGLGVSVSLLQYQVMGVFYPSTQRHYRKLILLFILLILLHVSVVDHNEGKQHKKNTNGNMQIVTT